MQAGSVLEGKLRAVSGASGTTVVPGRRAEREHELRAALSGIEASASELSQHRDHLTSTQVDELVDCLVAEIRGLRILCDGPAVTRRTFDLGDAIRWVVACAKASGLDVSFFLPPGVEVEGASESAAQGGSICVRPRRGGGTTFVLRFKRVSSK